MIPDHHKKIVAGLKKLKKANYEKIASNIGLDRHQVGRRLKEMEGLELVYKPGSTSLTSSGRQAYDYQLTGEGSKINIKEFTYKKGDKTAADHAKDLIKSIKTPIHNPLFDLITNQ